MTNIETCFTLVKQSIKYKNNFPLTDAVIIDIIDRTGILNILNDIGLAAAESRLKNFADLNKEYLIYILSDTTKIQNYIQNTKLMWEDNLIKYSAEWSISEAELLKCRNLLEKGSLDLQLQLKVNPNIKVNQIVNLWNTKYELELCFRSSGALSKAIGLMLQLSTKRTKKDFSLIDKIMWEMNKANRHYFGPYIHKNNFKRIIGELLLEHTALTKDQCIDYINWWLPAADKVLHEFVFSEAIYDKLPEN